MALDQTLELARNVDLCNHINLLTDTHLLSLPLNPVSPVRLFSSAAEPKTNKRLGVNGSVKCSTDYNSNEGHYDSLVGPQYPRPSETQWKKELCNSVQLMYTAK